MNVGKVAYNHNSITRAVGEENIDYQTIKIGNYEIYLVDKEGDYYDILTKVKVFEPAGKLMMED